MRSERAVRKRRVGKKREVKEAHRDGGISHILIY